MPVKKSTNFVGIGNTLNGGVIPAKRRASTAADMEPRVKKTRQQDEDDSADFVVSSDEEEEPYVFDDDDMAIECEELLNNEYELEDEFGNVTVVQRDEEDTVSDTELIAEVKATKAFKDNTTRANSRFITVINRAKVYQDIPGERIIPLGQTSKLDVPHKNIRVVPCANGVWTQQPKSKGNKKARARLRMMDGTELEAGGVNHPCDCRVCEKQAEFRAHLDGTFAQAKQQGKLRSGKDFKESEGHALGE